MTWMNLCQRDDAPLPWWTSFQAPLVKVTGLFYTFGILVMQIRLNIQIKLAANFRKRVLQTDPERSFTTSPSAF